MASAVRERLKAEGAIGFENYPVSVLRRMDLGPESCRDLLHYMPGRVVGLIRVTAGSREGKNMFKKQRCCAGAGVTDTELVLHDGQRLRRDGARTDQDVCITTHASQCSTVDQVVVLPDNVYVSL